MSRNPHRRDRFMLAAIMLAWAAAACVFGGLSGLSEYDGGDGYDTTGGGRIAVGERQSGELLSLFEAHNWSFDGQAGQTVTIRAVGQGSCDPRIKLIDPDGNIIDEDNNSGINGRDAVLTTTLPASGDYTIRVDVFKEGTYTITLE